MIIDYEKYSNKLYELAVGKDVLDRFNNYLNDDIEKQGLNIRKEVKNLKILLKEISYTDILIGKYKKVDEFQIYTINSFSKKIKSLIHLIDRNINEIEDENIKENMIDYYNENILDLFMDIEIEYKNFNRIHIPNGLPDYFKNIGLTEKIYLSMIKKLGYISSNNNGYINLAIKSIWEKISQRTDFYTIVFKSKIITFYSEMIYEELRNVLIKLFKNNTEEYTIDVDLLERYPNILDNKIIKKAI